LALITFLKVKYSSLKTTKGGLKKKIMKNLSASLEDVFRQFGGGSLMNRAKKLQDNIRAAAEAALNKVLHGIFSSMGGAAAALELKMEDINQMVKGNYLPMITYLNQNMGVNESIAGALLGKFTGNEEMTKENVGKLAETAGIPGAVVVNMGELTALGTSNKRENHKYVDTVMKKFLEPLFPNIKPGFWFDISELLAGKSGEVLQQLNDMANLPPILIDMVSATLDKDTEKTKLIFEQLIRKNLPAEMNSAWDICLACLGSEKESKNVLKMLTADSLTDRHYDVLVNFLSTLKSGEPQGVMLLMETISQEIPQFKKIQSLYLWAQASNMSWKSVCKQTGAKKRIINAIYQLSLGKLDKLAELDEVMGLPDDLGVLSQILKLVRAKPGTKLELTSIEKKLQVPEGLLLTYISGLTRIYRMDFPTLVDLDTEEEKEKKIEKRQKKDPFRGMSKEQILELINSFLDGIDISKGNLIKAISSIAVTRGKPGSVNTAHITMVSNFLDIDELDLRVLLDLCRGDIMDFFGVKRESQERAYSRGKLESDNNGFQLDRLDHVSRIFRVRRSDTKQIARKWFKFEIMMRRWTGVPASEYLPVLENQAFEVFMRVFKGDKRLVKFIMKFAKLAMQDRKTLEGSMKSALKRKFVSDLQILGNSDLSHEAQVALVDFSNSKPQPAQSQDEDDDAKRKEKLKKKGTKKIKDGLGHMATAFQKDKNLDLPEYRVVVLNHKEKLGKIFNEFIVNYFPRIGANSHLGLQEILYIYQGRFDLLPYDVGALSELQKKASDENIGNKVAPSDSDPLLKSEGFQVKDTEKGDYKEIELEYLSGGVLNTSINVDKSATSQHQIDFYLGILKKYHPIIQPLIKTLKHKTPNTLVTAILKATQMTDFSDEESTLLTGYTLFSGLRRICYWADIQDDPKDVNNRDPKGAKSEDDSLASAVTVETIIDQVLGLPATKKMATAVFAKAKSPFIDCNSLPVLRCILGFVLESEREIESGLRMTMVENVRFAKFKGSKMISGLMQIVAGKSADHPDVKAVCKRLNVDSNLFFAFKALADRDTKSLRTSIGSVAREVNTSQNIMMGMLGLAIDDISSLRAVADKIKVDYELLAGLISCAIGQHRDYPIAFRKLLKQVGIRSPKLAAWIIDLILGNENCVSEFSTLTKGRYVIPSSKVDVTKALVDIVVNDGTVNRPSVSTLARAILRRFFPRGNKQLEEKRRRVSGNFVDAAMNAVEMGIGDSKELKRMVEHFLRDKGIAFTKSLVLKTIKRVKQDVDFLVSYYQEKYTEKNLVNVIRKYIERKSGGVQDYDIEQLAREVFDDLSPPGEEDDDQSGEEDGYRKLSFNRDPSTVVNSEDALQRRDYEVIKNNPALILKIKEELIDICSDDTEVMEILGREASFLATMVGKKFGESDKIDVLTHLLLLSRGRPHISLLATMTSKASEVDVTSYKNNLASVSLGGIVASCMTSIELLQVFEEAFPNKLTEMLTFMDPSWKFKNIIELMVLVKGSTGSSHLQAVYYLLLERLFGKERTAIVKNLHNFSFASLNTIKHMIMNPPEHKTLEQLFQTRFLANQPDDPVTLISLYLTIYTLFDGDKDVIKVYASMIRILAGEYTEADTIMRLMNKRPQDGLGLKLLLQASQGTTKPLLRHMALDGSYIEHVLLAIRGDYLSYKKLICQLFFDSEGQEDISPNDIPQALKSTARAIENILDSLYLSCRYSIKKLPKLNFEATKPLLESKFLETKDSRDKRMSTRVATMLGSPQKKKKQDSKFAKLKSQFSPEELQTPQKMSQVFSVILYQLVSPSRQNAGVFFCKSIFGMFNSSAAQTASIVELLPEVRKNAQARLFLESLFAFSSDRGSLDDLQVVLGEGVTEDVSNKLTLVTKAIRGDINALIEMTMDSSVLDGDLLALVLTLMDSELSIQDMFTVDADGIDNGEDDGDTKVDFPKIVATLNKFLGIGDKEKAKLPSYAGQIISGCLAVLYPGPTALDFLKTGEWTQIGLVTTLMSANFSEKKQGFTELLNIMMDEVTFNDQAIALFGPWFLDLRKLNSEPKVAIKMMFGIIFDMLNGEFGEVGSFMNMVEMGKGGESALKIDPRLMNTLKEVGLTPAELQKSVKEIFDAILNNKLQALLKRFIDNMLQEAKMEDINMAKLFDKEEKMLKDLEHAQKKLMGGDQEDGEKTVGYDNAGLEEKDLSEKEKKPKLTKAGMFFGRSSLLPVKSMDVVRDEFTIDFSKIMELIIRGDYLSNLNANAMKNGTNALSTLASAILLFLRAAREIFEEGKVERPLAYKMFQLLQQTIESLELHKEFPDLKVILKVTPDTIALALTGISAVSKGDIHGMFEFADSLGEFDQQSMTNLFNILGKFKGFIGLGAPNKIEEMAEKGMSMMEMFKSFDKDDSGFISYWEFTDLCRSMGLNMSRDRFIQLFSLCDTSKDNQITFEEFENSLEILKEELTNETLGQMGFSSSRLVKIFLISLFVLLLLLMFVFTGIAAFRTGSAFSSVITSMFPITSGGVLSKGEKEPGDEDVKDGADGTVTSLKSSD